jgi:hypothetical protein
MLLLKREPKYSPTPTRLSIRNVTPRSSIADFGSLNVESSIAGCGMLNADWKKDERQASFHQSEIRFFFKSAFSIPHPAIEDSAIEAFVCPRPFVVCSSPVDAAHAFERPHVT